MSIKHFSRREFIQLSAAIVAASIMSNCQNTSEESNGPTQARSEKIIVIGAGMAGLAAARTLQAAGYEVSLLEGRDRIGGRVWTSHFWEDAPMDLGASWIHGVKRNPITALADEIDAPRQVTDYDSGLLYDVDGRQQPGREWGRYEEFEEIIENILEQAQELEADLSIEEAIKQFADLPALSEKEKQFLDVVVNSAYEQEWSGSISQLSAHNIDDGEDFGGDDVIFPEGYGSIPEYLAAGLDIQLEQKVAQISYTESGVTVTTNQAEYQADRVVVTLPLGVLKKGSVVFDPPLPAEKRDVISKMGFGVLNKVYLRFAEPFWQKQPEWFFYLSDRRGVWSQWFNIYHYRDEPILMAFNAADFGTELETWSDEKIISEGMDVLRKMFRDDIPDPESFQITRWIADPFAYGSYSFPAVGAPADARDVLAQPINNRLFFAGEATNSDYPSTVHGAYMSGLREAKRIQEL